jgi:Ca-activated chloride channel family protein
VAIKLSGDVNDDPREFVYEGTFPAANSDNTFVPHLWATRHVGYLMDNIRLQGEDQELKEEVIRLSKEFGIVTPYTSYLIVEDELPPQRDGIALPGRPTPMPRPELFEGGIRPRSDNSSKAAGERAAAAPAAKPMAQNADRFGLTSGRDALLISEAIRDYKESEVKQEETRGAVRVIDGHTFNLINGHWADTTEAKVLKTITVKFGSDAYFKLLSDKPELAQFFALGEKVTVILDRVAYIVD